MNKIVNIAIVGLGQVGIYLYNELRLKKKEIEKKTGKKINIVAISAKNKIITIKKAVRRLTELMNTMDTYGVSPT